VIYRGSRFDGGSGLVMMDMEREDTTSYRIAPHSAVRYSAVHEVLTENVANITQVQYYGSRIEQSLSQHWPNTNERPFCHSDVIRTHKSTAQCHYTT
jgi:hypothetical protein